MRRILFVISLLVVLNQIKSAEAVNVDTWTDFVVSSVGFNIDLTDNITQPDGDKKFSRTFNHNLNGNGYTISGGNGGKIFFKFNKASGKIENVTFKDFKSLENSGGFFISSGSEIELDKVTFNNISNPLDGGHETSWGGALNVDANSQNIKISNSNFIDNIQHTTTDNNGDSLGGALHIQGKMSDYDYSRLEYLKDSKFDGNQMNAHNSNAYGGAIFLEGQIGTFSGNELDNNQATISADGKNAYGGALAIGGANENRGTAQISNFEDNTFNNNLAQSGNGGTAQGGAVYVANSGKTFFKNSTFKNNKAAAGDGTARGGAISNSYAEDDMVSMSGLTMDSNVAEGAVAQGGAIYNDGVISDMSGDDDHEFVISNNKATSTVANVLGAYVGEGGGVYNSGTIKQINKVSFSSNEASESGGALFNAESGIVGALNADFSGNSAQQHGGALGNENLVASISGKFTSNRAEQNGGAIFNNRNAKINSISNSTFSGNTATKGGAIYNSGTISNLTDSKFETATDTIENVAGATIEIVKNVTAAASVNNAGTINEIDNSSFSVASGTALNNTSTIGKIKNSTFEYGSGTGIATTEDLNLVADNGNLTFSGAGTALEMGAGNMVNVKTVNGGKASFDGTIKANGGKLVLNGDNSDGSRIIFNGTVDNADISLANANLSLGNANVLTNSALNAQSGKISLALNNYDTYKIKNLTATENVKWNFNISLSKENGNKYNVLDIEDGSGTVYLGSLNVQDYANSMLDDETHTIQLIKSASGNAPLLNYDGAIVLTEAQAEMSTKNILAKEFGLATTDTTNDSIRFRGLMNSIAGWAELDTTLDKKFTFYEDASISRDIDKLRGKNLTLEGNGNVFDVNNKNMLAEIGTAQNVTINNLTLKNIGETANNGTLNLNGVNHTGFVANKAQLNTAGDTQIAGKLSNTGSVANSGNLTVNGGLQNESTITTADGGSLSVAGGNSVNSGTISGGVKFNNTTLNNSGEIDEITDSTFIDTALSNSSAFENSGTINKLENAAVTGDMLNSTDTAQIKEINGLTVSGKLQNGGKIGAMTGENKVSSLQNDGKLNSSESLTVDDEFVNGENAIANISGKLNAANGTVNKGTLAFNGVDYTGGLTNNKQFTASGSTSISGKLNNSSTGSVDNSGDLTVSGGLQNDGAITTADDGSLSVAGDSSVNNGTISGGVKFSDTTLDNSGKIDNIYDSSFKTADGTALNNTGTIGEIKNSTFEYGSGTGIATTEDLNLVADNGNLTFSGAGTALEMGAGNMVNVKTVNGGKASFDGTIKANGGKLALSGDNSNGSRIALNGTVDNADVSLVDANLSLGNTDVLANSYLKAESGTISFVQDNYGSYKIKKLESSENVKWNFNISLSKDDGNKYDALEIKDGSGTVYISSLDVSAAQNYTDSMDFEESHTIQLIKSSSDNAPELTYDQAKVLQQAQAVMSTDYFIAKEFGLATTKTKNDSIQFRGLMDSIAAWAELDTTLDKKFTFNADYSISRDITALRGKNLTLEGNGNKFDVKNKNMLAKIGAGQNVTINNLTLNNVGATENNGTLSLNEVAYNGDVTNNSHMNTDGNTQINGKFNNNGTVQNDGQLTLAADSENNGTIAGAGSVIAGNGTEVMNFANNGYISGKTYVSDKAVLESDLDKLNDVDIAVGGLFKVGADGELNQNISGEGEMLVSNLLNMGSGSLSQNGILTVADSGTINIGEKQVRVGTFNLNGTLALDISQITANSAIYTGGQIIVGDGANIAGDAKLRITVTADSLNKGSKTGELQLISGNNVSGLFNNIISNNRYDIVKGEQDGTVIIINTASAEDVANKVGNRNNRNTARAWDRVNVSAGSKAEQIYNILNDLSQHDAKEYVSALTKVAPADSQLAMMTTREVNNQINRSIWHRFGRNRALCNTPFASASAWIEGMGGYAHQNSSFEAAGFNARTAGYMLGIDGTVDCATTAGFGYAFNNTKATSQGRDTGIKGHTAFAYAKYQPKQAYVRGTISYGYADYDERSAVQNVDIKAKYHVQALSTETAAGYEFTDGFIPEAGLRYTYLMPQKYTDNFGQHVQAENTDLLTGFVGMRYRPRCGAIWYNVRPTAYVGMSYDIYNRDTKANVSIADQQYEISGQKLPRWGLETGVGVEVSVNPWDLSVGYDFGLREKYQSHTGMFNARYNF